MGAGLGLRREAESLRRARAAITPYPPPPPRRVPVSEELPDRYTGKAPPRFLPPVGGDSGSPVPNACQHPLRTSRVLQSRPVTQGGGGGTREPHGRRVPAAQPAGAPRSGAAAASRDLGTHAPGPGALLPGAPTGRSRPARALGRGLGRGRSQARGRCQVAPVTVTCRGVGGANTQVAYFRK